MKNISLAFGGVKALTDISFDVRGGLLLRQMHHWAAHIFIAAMLPLTTGGSMVEAAGGVLLLWLGCRWWVCWGRWCRAWVVCLG